MTIPSSRAPQDEPRYYDVKRVAAILGVSPMTIYRAIRSGEIRAVRVRRRFLIPVGALDDLARADVKAPDA